MPSNFAAWQTGPYIKAHQVRSAPYTSPGEKELVIRNGAVAINPADWILQGPLKAFMFKWIEYPMIFGSDVAGEVVEVGPGVTRFKVGDRVLSNACGLNENLNDPSKSAFQNYTVLLEHMTSPIPSNMSYESACVLPLGISTAACGLFQKDQLALDLPKIPAVSTGKTILVWGGSTSVGSGAIQLAVAAGYSVVATASPRNFEYCRRLGASQVFDYNSQTVVKDLIAALEKADFAGAFSAGVNSAEACFAIVGKLKTGRFVSMASYPTLVPQPTTLFLPRTAMFFASWMAKNTVKMKLKGIRWNTIFGSTLVDNGIGQAIYQDFLPRALEEGLIKPEPEALVVGKGLEALQNAFDIQEKGVSAKKVVVLL